MKFDAIEVTVAIRCPEVGPDDIQLLTEVSETLPAWGTDELRAGLQDLSGRIRRMLRTAAVRAR